MPKKIKILFYSLFIFSFSLLLLNINSAVMNFKIIVSLILNPDLVAKNYRNISGISERVRVILNCKNEIELLKKEITELKEKLVIYEPIFNESIRLKEIVSTPLPSKISGMYASVISYNPHDPYSFFYINRGADDGVKNYNPVLFFEKDKKKWRVIGRVVEVYPSYSRVMLVTSSDFSFVVMTLKSKGVAFSNGGGNITYKYIDGDLEEGEEVLTADTSYTFPPYMYVGDIKNIKKNPDPSMARAEVSVFKIKDIDFVYVINWQPYLIKEKL